MNQGRRLVYLPRNNFKRDGISYSEVYTYNGEDVEDYTCKNFLGYAPTNWCKAKGVKVIYDRGRSRELQTPSVCGRQAVLDSVGCNRRQLGLYLTDKRLSHVVQFKRGENVRFKNLGPKEIRILKKLHREHTSKH